MFRNVIDILKEEEEKGMYQQMNEPQCLFAFKKPSSLPIAQRTGKKMESCPSVRFPGLCRSALQIVIAGERLTHTEGEEPAVTPLGLTLCCVHQFSH